MYNACIEKTDRMHCDYQGSITDVLRMHWARVADTSVVLRMRGICIAVIKSMVSSKQLFGFFYAFFSASGAIAGLGTYDS